MTRRILLALVAATLVGAGAAARQAQPLPDPAPFLAGVRAHLRTDRALLSQYVYNEKKRDVSLNVLGKLTVGGVEVSEVYPGLDPKDTYRRVIDIDGRPRDPRRLAEEDEKFRKKLLESIRKREQETAADRRKREEDDAKKKREEEATFDDVFRIYRIVLVDRQMRDGRPIILATFEPKPDAQPRTDDGKRLKKIKGRAWISEPDFELARVEFEVLDDISVGGVLGKLYKGATSSVERKKINDEVWLPSEARYDISGRVLIRRFHVYDEITFSNYRKFTAGTGFTINH